MTFNRSTLLFGITAAALGAVGLALVSQHVFEMQPCPFCVLLRLIFIVIAAVALIGLAWRSALGRQATTGLIVLLCGAGIFTALWQHFVAAASNSCNLSWADRLMTALQLDALLPEVFQPRASCADAAYKLLGVSFEFWGLALCVMVAAAAVSATKR